MNSSKQFLSKVDQNKYQVFLFKSKCALPVTFASHTWFVINKKGVLGRWEVVYARSWSDTDPNHLVVNFQAPFLGVTIIPLFPHGHFKAKLLCSLSGDDGSIAKEIIDFIENSSHSYPYCNFYKLTGPNSNTYTQWILDKFPEFKVKLPWNAFGKNYKI